MSTLYVNNIEPVSGSTLTLISASLIAVDDLTVTSLTSSFKGNLQGTASFATTASHALNSTSPSGVSGAIQFSDGSAFASDASNLFWDDTNKRLGIGTSTPTNTLHVTGGSSRLSNIYFGFAGNNAISNSGSDTTININNGVGIAGGSIITPSARLHIKGSGTTSATTALLVQNSSGNELFSIKDNGLFTFKDVGGGDALTIENGGNISEIRYNDNLWIGSSHGTYSPTIKIDRLSGLSVETNSGSLLNLIYATGNLGIGETTPTARLQVKGSGSTSATTSLLVQNSASANLLSVLDDGKVGVGTNVPAYKLDVVENRSGDLFGRLQNSNSGGFGMLIRAGNGASTYTMQWSNYLGVGGGRLYPDGVYIGDQSAPTARLHVKGSGTTSATTSLLVQNSSGTDIIRINDLGLLQFGGATASFPALKRVGTGLELKSADDTINGEPTFTSFNIQVRNLFYGADALSFGYSGGTTGFRISNVGASSFGVSVTDAPASAQLEVRSTTKGFLPPRMTTTQKNAISSPASGLMVYDTDLNQMSYYNGTSWVNF